MRTIRNTCNRYQEIAYSGVGTPFVLQTFLTGDVIATLTVCVPTIRGSI